jgi:hypothetical protein
MRLVNEKTGQPVKVGDVVKTFRGEQVMVTSLHPPHKINSSGHVTCRSIGKKWTQEFYPSVIGARYID